MSYLVGWRPSCISRPRVLSLPSCRCWQSECRRAERLSCRRDHIPYCRQGSRKGHTSGPSMTQATRSRAKNDDTFLLDGPLLLGLPYSLGQTEGVRRFRCLHINGHRARAPRQGRDWQETANRLAPSQDLSQ